MSQPAIELDPVIHAQARLRVTVALAALAHDDQITFPRLRELLGMTAGNLSIHLRKLEEAGYVEIVKTHQRRTSVTLVNLTATGREAFDRYVAAVRSLLPSPSPEPLLEGQS
ncbi:MAG TPA: transcriptional regulator [Micromonosporaceae bacterium]|jgi:DNA-binding MarR family transcriptional regulator